MPFSCAPRQLPLFLAFAPLQAGRTAQAYRELKPRTSRHRRRAPRRAERAGECPGVADAAAPLPKQLTPLVQQLQGQLRRRPDPNYGGAQPRVQCTVARAPAENLHALNPRWRRLLGRGS
jgi:hypothetical protein